MSFVEVQVDLNSGATRTRYLLVGFPLHTGEPSLSALAVWPSSDAAASVPPHGDWRRAQLFWLCGDYSAQYECDLLEEIVELSRVLPEVGVTRGSEIKSSFLSILRTKGPFAARRFARQVLKDSL